MATQFEDIAIIGVSIVLGENRRNFDDEPNYWKNDQNLLARLKKTIGFGVRYTANPDTTACDLAFSAAQRLMLETKLQAESFDAIISVTQTPDYYLPQNAHLLHDKLGMLKTTMALDICNGCSGYIQGLYISFSLIKSGLNRVLLCVGDTLSKAVNVKDRTEYPLFTDCACATVIERKEGSGATTFIMRSDGAGYKHIIQPAGAYRNRSTDATRSEKEDGEGNVRSDEDVYLNGFEIFKFATSEQPSLLSEAIAAAGGVDSIDIFLLHQANKHIVSTIARSAHIPAEKTPIIFSEYANQNGSSIVGVICDRKDYFQNEKRRVIMQGFGVGLSWGACVTTLENICVLKPYLYGAI
jgi:3-oxoacyl-[acyl-carrier-protein] synthase-3